MLRCYGALCTCTPAVFDGVPAETGTTFEGFALICPIMEGATVLCERFGFFLLGIIITFSKSDRPPPRHAHCSTTHCFDLEFRGRLSGECTVMLRIGSLQKRRSNHHSRHHPIRCSCSGTRPRQVSLPSSLTALDPNTVHARALMRGLTTRTHVLDELISKRVSFDSG